MNSGTRVAALWPRGAAVVAYCATCVLCVCLATCGRPVGGGSTSVSYRAGDDQNGKTITMQPGQTLLVTLASTYWSFQGSSNPQVLAPVGTPTVSPAPVSTCPVAGSG